MVVPDGKRKSPAVHIHAGSDGHLGVMLGGDAQGASHPDVFQSFRI